MAKAEAKISPAFRPSKLKYFVAQPTYHPGTLAIVAGFLDWQDAEDFAKEYSLGFPKGQGHTVWIVIKIRGTSRWSIRSVYSQAKKIRF